MGCGSSGQVVAAEGANGSIKANGRSNGHGNHHDDDNLPTVVLPETPAKKPPSLRNAQAVTSAAISLMTSHGRAIAFEIPLEEFDGNKRGSTTPPPHLQRLLQPPQAEISLPDIEEKLAEAEQRRQTILQQRAASAQKRSQKMMKSFSEMEQVDSERESMNINNSKQYSSADPMKTDLRTEEPFTKKTDTMNTDPRTSNRRDGLQPMVGSKVDSRPMGISQKDQLKEGSIKNDLTKRDSMDSSKFGTNAVRLPPEPGVCEDKNI